MKLNPYLFFDGTCEEAFRFYEKHLGAKIEMLLTHAAAMGEEAPPEDRDKIMHGRIVIGDTVVMASDAPKDRYDRPQGFSISIGVSSPAEVERIFNAFSEGGSVVMAPEKTFFAERFAMIVDRFGTRWMVICEPAVHREIDITRVLDAPRDLAFRLWTEPRHMAQWWGPKDFTNPVCDMDARPGGAMRIVMRAPDGAEHPMTGLFHEVVAPERLVFTAVARDASGNPLLEALTRVTFADMGGKTKLTVHATGVGIAAAAPQMLDGMEEGWTQTVDRLAALATRRKEKAA